MHKGFGWEYKRKWLIKGGGVYGNYLGARVFFMRGIVYCEMGFIML
jgi:hypothetical protein